MTQAEVWTIGRLLRWTTEFLQQRGSETPRLDAEVLLAHAHGWERIQLYTHYEDVPGEEVRSRFREMIRRRAEGVPVAYLVGEREFFSLKFRVTPDVLIPRPETEFVLVTLLERARQSGQGGWRICDVGTGSGVLAICAAKHLPDSQILAIDKSPQALAVAKENAIRHHVADRIEWLESDLLEAVPSEMTFDFIISNPPYVSEAEFANLPTTVRNYEPYQALVAGPRGTEVIERLIPQAAEKLVTGGYLIFEISPMICQRVCELVEADGRFRLGPVVRDLARLPRVIQAQRV